MPVVASPRPRVPEPDRWQHVNRRRFVATVHDGDAAQDVFRGRLGILDEDVEVAMVREGAGVDQLVLRLAAAAAPVLLHEFRVRERPMRILVEVFHVGVRRSAVQIEVVLLDVLAVVAFVARQPECALLQDRIATIPQGHREADDLVPVADAGEAILVPPVGARAGVVVREVLPGRPVGTVVFADSAPRTVADIGAPALPVRDARVRRVEAELFCAHDGFSRILTVLWPFGPLTITTGRSLTLASDGSRSAQ